MTMHAITMPRMIEATPRVPADMKACPFPWPSALRRQRQSRRPFRQNPGPPATVLSGLSVVFGTGATRRPGTRSARPRLSPLLRQILLQPLRDHGGDLPVVLLQHHDVAVTADAELGEPDEARLDPRLL